MELKYKKNSLAIVIPMYNEEKNASKCIDAVIEIIKKLKTHTQLIIVNDGSQDGTQKIVEQKNKQYKDKLKIISYTKNKGYGKALQKGIKEAIKNHYEYVLFMDSDLTNDPKYIATFVKEIPQGYDCVKASRYIYGGGMVGISLKRRIFSLISSIITRNLFRIGLRDCTNGFRMVKLAILKDIQFKENNFSIILEELYYLKCKHATFKEIPIILTSRKNSLSHFNYTSKLLYDYLKYAIKASFI